MSGPEQIAQVSWNGCPPEWVAQLALRCAATSQNRVAAAMGLSASLISQVLRNKYPGDLQRIEELFRGHFMDATLTCPELGVMPLHACHDWMAKARGYSNSNHHRVRMFRACQRCPRFSKGGSDG
ncbi:MAG: hypothetical protein JJU24_08480 [Natronohydrobacter sp.]|nr:hypothetical protein [Natronohydrobacter sp.]